MKDTFKEAWEKSRSEGVILRDNANKKVIPYWTISRESDNKG